MKSRLAHGATWDEAPCTPYSPSAPAMTPAPRVSRQFKQEGSFVYSYGAGTAELRSCGLWRGRAELGARSLRGLSRTRARGGAAGWIMDVGTVADQFADESFGLGSAHVPHAVGGCFLSLANLHSPSYSSPRIVNLPIVNDTHVLRLGKALLTHPAPRPETTTTCT